MDSSVPRTARSREVPNQPPPFENVNLFSCDRVLCEALAREAAAITGTMNEFGAFMGSARTWQMAAAIHRDVTELRRFDRYGHRIDEVEYHPWYHVIMRRALEAGIAAAPWRGDVRGHTLHAALEFLLAKVEPSVCCPVTMTYAAPASLKHALDFAGEWLSLIVVSKYDVTSCSSVMKADWTVGMAMTDK